MSCCFHHGFGFESHLHGKTENEMLQQISPFDREILNKLKTLKQKQDKTKR